MRNIHIIAIILLAVSYQAQTVPFSKKARQLTGTFNTYHVEPLSMSESVSGEIVELFIPELDNTGMILNENDRQALKKNSTTLFDQINANTNDYVIAAEKIFTRALSSLDSILAAISARPLDFSGKDTLFILPAGAKRQYPPDLKAQAKRVEKYIRFKSYEKVSDTEAASALSEKEFNLKAQGFSKTVIDNLRKNIKKQISGSYAIVESTLLNAIAMRYDPHSNYFTQEQNSEFSQHLSATVESFGLQLGEDEEGAIHVAAIEPGGSAWLSNDINEGDLFISVKIGADLVSNGDVTADDVQTLLNNCTEKNIVLTLKKPNGLVKSVRLVKQKISSEENSVQGYVLKDGRLNIGYLSLPSFYTDMEEHNLPGCANDVAKEILKLEKDTIQGLIIDLRNNGGGSMQETMNLAGIFIDEGPLFIYKEKNKKPMLMKDLNRGSIFKKPIVVMINETSASASELFSNIVKDYQLGLVVGQSSFGKGTAQNIMPLDTTLLNTDFTRTTSDFIKMTTAKFYRLNCRTHQGNGVEPDIELPSFAGSSNYKENKEHFYLRPDSVTKKLVFNPNAPIAVEPIRARSQERVRSSAEFKRLARVSDSLSLLVNAVQKVPLTFEGYKKYKSETERFYTAFENAMEAGAGTLSCLNNSFDKDLAEVNPQVKEFNAKALRSIEKDIFINESFEIMKDLINPEKK